MTTTPPPAGNVSLLAIIEAAARRFNARPLYRASIEAQRELGTRIKPQDATEINDPH